MKRLLLGAALLTLCLLSSCQRTLNSEPSSTTTSQTQTPTTPTPSTQPSDTQIALNRWVQTQMQDWYLWYDEMPELDVSTYVSANEVIRALAAPRDRWSYITSASQDSAWYSGGQFVGFGLSWSKTDHDADGYAQALIVLLTYEGPAQELGLVRGDKIVAIDGRSINAIERTDDWETALGPDEVGQSVMATVQRRSGTQEQLRLYKDVSTVNPITTHSVFDQGENKVGYVSFRTFISSAVSALDDVFAEFRAAQVSDVIIDLRYNGGGLVSVGQHLANLLIGADHPGALLQQARYNEKHSHENWALFLKESTQSLHDLERVFFITTGGTASASELVINGLAPFTQVVQIGETTHGKPVGMNGFTDPTQTWIFHPITFILENKDGYGSYFNGLAPTCQATDDPFHDLGDQHEAMLATVLNYIETGRCIQSSARQAAPSPLIPFGVTGFQRDKGVM